MISRKLEEYIYLSQKKVEENLEKILKERSPEIIYQAMRYSVFAGGKRLRPLLCLLSYQMVSKDQIVDEKILDIASAIELIHTYSLIHDDLPAMDNDVFAQRKTDKSCCVWRSNSYFSRRCTFKFSSRSLHGLDIALWL